MKVQVLQLGLLVLAVTTGEATAASFDCANAKSRVEHLICDTPTLSQADEGLQAIYARTRGALPEAEVSTLRDAQLQWLKQRAGCADTACLAASMEDRKQALEVQATKAEAVFDQIVASIPQDPVAAARGLASYHSPLADAWRVYLGRFEPAAGIDPSATAAARARATVALEKADSLAAEVLSDVAKDPKTPAGEADLMLLRNWIEQAEYGQAERPYVHCFIFSRQGQVAFDAMGALYGSTRDNWAPLCPPQGDLFEQPAWVALVNAFEPLLMSPDPESMGTMRFATYAQWHAQDLMATVAPALFLSPDMKKLWPVDDPQKRIEAYAGNPHWPEASQRAALAALEPARQQTTAWLVKHRNLSQAQARQLAERIVQVWVASRDEYVQGWLDDNDSKQ